MALRAVLVTCLGQGIAGEYNTVDTLITHTPRENPQIMGYEGLWAIRVGA